MALKSPVPGQSTLTSIHSAEENKFVRQLAALTSYAWIGLFNLNSRDHSYEWVDGSMVDFRNWDDGEPNNYLGPGENCTKLLVTGEGKWSDGPCNFGGAFLVRKRWSPWTPMFTELLNRRRGGDCRPKLLLKTLANIVAQKQTLENKKTFYYKYFKYKMVLNRADY